MKNPPNPEPLPHEWPKYEKTSSYSPPQFNRLLAPPGPVRSWGGGSYKANGRPSLFNEPAPGYGDENEVHVEHTTKRGR
jgi:hypothetical protein